VSTVVDALRASGESAGEAPEASEPAYRVPKRLGRVPELFGRLVRSLGIASGSSQPRPRLHDLRFYFANQALTNGPAHDIGISRHMVALTTYLGHRDVRNSYWYLEATPGLLARIAAHCEDFVNGGHP
jgi:integrase